MRRYRFGPLERRGVVGGLRAPSALVLASGFAADVLLLNAAGPGAVPLTILLLAFFGALALWPWSGRPAIDWAVLGTRHLATRARGAHRYRSPHPTLGRRAPNGHASGETLVLP